MQKGGDDIITIIITVTTTNNWNCGFQSISEAGFLLHQAGPSVTKESKLGLRREIIHVFLRLNYNYRQREEAASLKLILTEPSHNHLGGG